MGKEMLKTESPLYIDYKPNNSSLFTFDLPALIGNMKKSHSWAKGELNAMILLRSPQKQVILTLMRSKTEVKSFQSNDSVTLRIIEGKLRFTTWKESITLVDGQVLILHENINYNLIAKEETVLLITIANNILQPSENLIA
jgi:quercetin dioxygenase-like cupin family protein